MPAGWDATLLRLPAEARNPLWRRYSDALNQRLLEGWMGAERFTRALKTDAYDEAFGRGVYWLLAERAAAVTLTDCSLFALREARVRQGAVCDVRALPFAGGSFDLIFSGSTLDHFPDADDILAALRELARVLRAGGRLILTLDNPVNPLVRLRNALPQVWLRRLGLTPYPVGVTLGPAALSRALQQAGLEPGRCGVMGHCPRLPAVLLCRVVGGGRLSQRLLGALLAFERLANWPGRYLTGYYIAVEAWKP